MSNGIETVAVLNPNLQAWGVEVVDYKYKGDKVDLQDLMIEVTAHRATVIESEVAPMSTRMEKRNKYLEELGNALSDLSQVQAKFKSDAAGSDCAGPISQKTGTLVNELNVLAGATDPYGLVGRNPVTGKLYEVISKSNCEKAVQLIKTRIDRLNNDASTDMTRLQSLVDRRDESFSTATSLMQAIGDTRSGVIKNM